MRVLSSKEDARCREGRCVARAMSNQECDERLKKKREVRRVLRDPITLKFIE